MTIEGAGIQACAFCVFSVSLELFLTFQTFVRHTFSGCLTFLIERAALLNRIYE